ncbi:aspartate ammonia-lyase [Candidatus Gracilibacteria bacterium]|nr:aspartate ammonia-lyase [Candidatus Gracilibacteria bacterium]
MEKTRIERDAIGEYPVPADAYFGIFTARASKNFQLTGQRAPRVYIQALGLLKQACARANHELGLLDETSAKAIDKAAQEFLEGQFDFAFPIDVIQAGAGTPYNMNSNEVIANRANEILGMPLGSYKPVHPNNHVNMSQSSNDVTPTALRIAALFLVEPLINAATQLADSFKTFAQKHRNLIKVGRTHLEDAVPMTLGQEFHAYATMIHKSIERIKFAANELLELGIGGTALGSGITTHPHFRGKVISHLSKTTKMKFRATDDLFETTSGMNCFVAVSGACRTLAIDLVKIANDLKILNMGPLAGIQEITLPEVEPGSSIMPGKVNPSVAEAVHMAGYDVLASDHAISLASQAGQLQLNVMTPLIIKHLLGSLSLLRNTCDMFRVDCVEGIMVNEGTIKKLYEGSLVTATALNPYLGYEVTAELVKEGLAKGKSIIDVVRERKLLEEKVLESVLSPEATTRPAITDLVLKKHVQASEAYLTYKAEIKK